MSAITLSHLIEQSSQLVSLPDIVINLNNIVNDPKSTITDFAEQIELDPGLTVQLLKIVNSPYYNFGSQVDTIFSAVSIIGTQDLRDLVLTTSLVSSFKGLNNPLCTLENFWRHSVYCGVIARKLAECIREPNSQRYFTAGLLHDIGSMIFYQALPEQSTMVLRRAMQNNTPLQEAEEDTFGFTSADLGAELIKSWNLPSMLEETTRYHNIPEQSAMFSTETTIIYIANHLANFIDPESNRLQRNHEIEEKYWLKINLPCEIMDTTKIEIIEKFDQITSLIINELIAA